jgi:ketosteroid isomerase-like protein
MKASELEQHVRTMYAAFAAGDADAYRTAFAEDIVWHVPGENPVSGAYRGSHEYLVTMPERMGPLDEWVITPGEVSVNARDRAALVAFQVTGSRRGRRVDMGGHHMIRLDESGRVVEGWGFAEDQAALDEFFSA